MARPIAVTSPRSDRPQPLERLLAPLITREIATIAGIDAAIAAEAYPDYVTMYQAAKAGKQANVAQMVTLVRQCGGEPPEYGGLRRHLLKSGTAVVERIAGTTATLHAMRAGEVGLLKGYTDGMRQVQGVARLALRKALSRTLVHGNLLTAHIAKRSGHPAEAASLAHPLDRYFAGRAAKACMRCHLDRPGAYPALERGDPHPYTYICAGCHVDVRAEFPADLASQFDRWPRHMQEARVLQHAIGRPSILNAIHTVLYPLSGLKAERPVPAEKHAVTLPAPEPAPVPAAGETRTILTADPRTPGETEYVAELFDFRSVRAFW